MLETFPIPIVKPKTSSSPKLISKKIKGKGGEIKTIKIKQNGIIYPDDVEGYHYLICPICGKMTRVPLSGHLMKDHNMTTKEFKEKYPDFDVVPKGYNHRISLENFLKRKNDKETSEAYEAENIIETNREEEETNERMEIIVKEEEKIEDIRNNFFVENPFELLYKKLSNIDDRIAKLEKSIERMERLERMVERLYVMWK